MAANDLDNLEPKDVWKNFYDISQIPRCSRHEEKIINYLESFAQHHTLSYKKDDIGNICIKKSASPGFEKRPGIILQGHVDMVCEKNTTVSFNFETDPLNLKKEGDWLTADGTTLGADNGIAVAMAMAVLADKSLQHGPVEALFTVDEETGLTGAANLDPSIIEGNILLNIDSEEEGTFYIGCAGGITTIGEKKITRERAPENTTAVSFAIKGLRGGHSGAEIHEGRGNSVVMGARILYAALQKYDIRLYNLDGGDKHNAIPREFAATLAVHSSDVEDIKALIREYGEIFKAESGDIEPDLKTELTTADSIPEGIFSKEDTETVIKTLFSLPHGVISMSRKLPGLVETSTNAAAVHSKGSSVTFLTSQRSSVMSQLDHIAEIVKVLLQSGGADISLEGQHPAWDPDPDSSILKTFKEVYKRTTSREPEIAAIHAGLECGVIGENFKDMEMISFGPDMKDVHTPDERLNIPSVKRTWDFLLEVLKSV